MVQENFVKLMDAGLFETKIMEQYYELSDDGNGRFLPDRYVEGTCPACGDDGARGDQCDTCGATYESAELKNPVSKMNPSAQIEIRETEHLFYRLDLFQKALETGASTTDIVAKKQVLRDAPADSGIDAASDEADLKAQWNTSVLGDSPYS